MVAQTGMKWRPIEDLPDDLGSLTNPELASLGNVWREQKELLEGTEAIRSFNERLQRKWAIETGQDAGVWGGLSEDERRALKRRTARQRRAS